MDDFAMRLVKGDFYDKADELFTFCENLLKKYGGIDHIQKKVQLFNNMSYLKRKQGDFSSAKVYLEKAINISCGNRGLSYLNLCVLTSSMGNHKEAL